MTPTHLPDGLDIVGIRTPGLGDATYLVTYEGRGLIIDPQRDIDRFLDHMSEADVDLRWILETHLHNDYVSGGVVAAQRSGAELILPAAAAPNYRHTPAFHFEDIGDTSLTIRPIHTPGHTPEHTSYLLVVEGEPVALFSGGSLLVGSAGRPDLLGTERADSLARLQFRSVNRLAQLPNGVGLYPTHGEGSFCTVSGAGQTTSTIGEERQTNPVLAYQDEDSFVAGQLAVLQPYPTYYRHMGPANVAGGTAMPETDLPVLDADAVVAMGDDVQVIDIRNRHHYAAGHIPGSLGVELRDDFGVWVGWLVDIDQPLVLVADITQDVTEARTQLARIGYDRLRGVMYRIDSWRDSGRPLESHDVVNLTQFAGAVAGGARTLDVRAPNEWEEGHLEGSSHVYVPDLATYPFDELAKGDEVWVACGTGYRANIAAGILTQKGLRPVVLADGGVPDLIQKTQEPLAASASR
ncbi:MAG: rhodanese-like domain-containing protein [Acidimicrobiia bacterium]|jgi:glyoxylase-like metal-dependent hydrolase (beta-lactamase superfamily II)